MEFLKSRNEYIVVYNKQQAIKQLKLDRRIQKIISIYKGMIITTKPVILDNEDCQYPIGTFTIKIKEHFRKIDVKINRLEGYINCAEKYLSFHIRRVFDFDNICWGSLEEDIYEIKEHKDWFWLVKCVLEILYDNEDEDSPEDFISTNYALQLNYLYVHNNYKINKEILNLLKKETYNECNQIEDNTTWWMKSHNAIPKKKK